MSEPIHPESYHTLEQLVKLHGVKKLMDAISEISRRTVSKKYRAYCGCETLCSGRIVMSCGEHHPLNQYLDRPRKKGLIAV